MAIQSLNDLVWSAHAILDLERERERERQREREQERERERESYTITIRKVIHILTQDTSDSSIMPSPSERQITAFTCILQECRKKV